MLPDNHLREWLLFVRACSILCSRIITKTDLEAAHSYIQQFSLEFIKVYGHEHFTPNMTCICIYIIAARIMVQHIMAFGALPMVSWVLIKQIIGTLKLKL